MQNQTQGDVDIVGDLIDIVRETLGAAAFSPDAARAVEARIRFSWGGQDAYIKKAEIDVEARDAAIRQRYNMCNRRELMAEYGVGRTHFYRILKRG